MFPEVSSDESVDSDDEVSVQARRRRQKLKSGSDPIRIPFDSAKELGIQSRWGSNVGQQSYLVDDGEPDFVIDSTGGAGNMGIKNTDKRYTLWYLLWGRPLESYAGLKKRPRDMRQKVKGKFPGGPDSACHL